MLSEGKLIAVVVYQAKLAHSVIHRLDWINDTRGGLESNPKFIDIIDGEID